MALEQVYLRVLRFSPVITMCQCYTPIFNYVLLWTRTNGWSLGSTWNRGAMVREALSLLFCI